MRGYTHLFGIVLVCFMAVGCQNSSNPSSDNVSSTPEQESSSDLLSSSSSIVIPDISSSHGSSSSPAVSFGTIVDERDTKTYKTVKIGNQNWMAENLAYVPWGRDGIGGACCHKDSVAICEKEGRLYNWVTAMDLPDNCQDDNCSHLVAAEHQGACPSGWHIPQKSDWQTLLNVVGSAGALKAVVPGNDAWNDPSLNDQDPFGFAALPAGIYGYNLRLWYSRGEQAYFWSTAERTSSEDFTFAEHWNASVDSKEFYNYQSAKFNFYSVRCLQNR